MEESSRFQEFTKYSPSTLSQTSLFLSAEILPVGSVCYTMEIDQHVIDEFEDKVVKHPEVIAFTVIFLYRVLSMEVKNFKTH